jgi:hypothetical protein
MLTLAASGGTVMAQDRTVIEQVIAAQNPCGSLKVAQLGVSIGIDQLDYVEIDEVDLTLRGNDVTARLGGRLACRTPASSFVQGDASASLRADTALNLEDCSMRSLNVQLDRFGGSFKDILAALKGELEQLLASRFQQTVIDQCRRFKAG